MMLGKTDLIVKKLIVSNFKLQYYKLA